MPSAVRGGDAGATVARESAVIHFSSDRGSEASARQRNQNGRNKIIEGRNEQTYLNADSVVGLIALWHGIYSTMRRLPKYHQNGLFLVRHRVYYMTSSY